MFKSGYSKDKKALHSLDYLDFVREHNRLLKLQFATGFAVAVCIMTVFVTGSSVLTGCSKMSEIDAKINAIEEIKRNN